MNELLTLLRESLPEAIGGLLVAAILGLIGALYTTFKQRKADQSTKDVVISMTSTVPEELHPTGPLGGRQPRRSVTKRIIEKAGETDDFKQKKALFEEAIRLDAGDPVGYRLLAWVSQRLTDYPSAIQYDSQALAIDPSFSKAYVGLIISGNRTKNNLLVSDSWAKLQKVSNKKEHSFYEGAYWYADAQGRHGNKEEAKHWFRYIVESGWQPASSYEARLLNDVQQRLK